MSLLSQLDQLIAEANGLLSRIDALDAAHKQFEQELADLRKDIERKSKPVVTTPKYWDCKCEDNYIHPKRQPRCKICGAFANVQPDSRVNEVEAKGLPL